MNHTLEYSSSVRSTYLEASKEKKARKMFLEKMKKKRHTLK